MSRDQSMAVIPSNDKLKAARVTAKKMDTEVVNGIPYFRYTLTGVDFPTMFRNIREAELQCDDVISVGFPRSGNHWAFEVINMVLKQSTDFEEAPCYKRMFEFMGEDVEARLRSVAAPRVFTSHCRLSELPKQIHEKKLKVIYVLRNPKDSMVSWYRLIQSKALEKDCFLGSWEEFFELQMTGELPWGNWFDHVLSMEQFTKDHPEVPLYVFQYEKVKADPVFHIRELCRFLGQPEILAEDIAAATDKNNMRKVAKFDPRLDTLFNNDADGVISTDKVDTSDSYFTKGQNERLNVMFDQVERQSSLAARVKPYLE